MSGGIRRTVLKVGAPGLAMTMLAASMATPAADGTVRPFLIAAERSDVEITPLITSGDMVGDYRMAAVPDGLGLMMDGDKAVRYVDQELTTQDVDEGDTAGNRESAGIIDASGGFGPGAWLTAVQAHSVKVAQLGGEDESGQILLLRTKEGGTGVCRLAHRPAPCGSSRHHAGCFVSPRPPSPYGGAAYRASGVPLLTLALSARSRSRPLIAAYAASGRGTYPAASTIECPSLAMNRRKDTTSGRGAFAFA